MPKKLRHQLTSARVKSLREPGDYTDGDGLVLRVGKDGGKTWVQRITTGGRQRWMTLGKYLVVSLADARKIALSNLSATAAGDDPVAERQRRLQDAKDSAHNAAQPGRPPFGKLPRRSSTCAAPLGQNPNPITRNSRPARCPITLTRSSATSLWTPSLP